MAISNKTGFTLLETLVGITIGVLLLGLVLAIYTLTIRSVQASETRSELTQNSRVIMERLTRDLRQTRALATVLPPASDDPLHPPPDTLEILDGHNTSAYLYLRYYLAGADLKRQVKQYYFATDPTVFVPWDAEDDFGNPPLTAILEDELVGQYVGSLKFYGLDLVYIELTLAKGNITHTAASAVFGRNL